MYGNLKQRGFREIYTRFPTARYESDVIDWRRIVIANGGKAPTSNVMNTLSVFIQDLKSSGIYKKMQSVNCFVGTDLITAKVPLIYKTGLNFYTDMAGTFTSADLTKDGLKGDAINKALGTGVIVSGNSIFTPESSVDDGLAGVGMSLYVSQGVSETVRDIGSQTNLVMHISLSGTANVTIGNGGGITGACPNGLSAFYSSNRFKGTVSHQFGSNSYPWTKLTPVTGLSLNPTYPSVAIYLYCSNDGGIAYPCSKRYSFSAIHTGLDINKNEPYKLFTAVHRMRKALGGGWV